MKPALRHLLLGSRWGMERLFRGGADGLWLQARDLSTIYEDAAGTTAGAVGQPVGLVLDKHAGAALGGEKAVNGGFDADASWSKGAGVTISGGKANFAAVAAGAARLQQTSSIGGSPALKTYRIEYTISDYSAGSVRFLIGGGAGTYGQIRSANGSYSEYIHVASGVTTDSIEVYVQAIFTGAVDNISVRELPGNHLTQSTSASRQVLAQTGGYYNDEFDGFDDFLTSATGGGGSAGFFFCAAIRVTAGAGTARYVWNDRNGLAGYLVIVSTTNKLQFVAGDGAAQTSVLTTDDLTIDGDYVITAWDDGTNLNAQRNLGTVASGARPPVVAAGTASFTVGKHNTATANYFPGRIYEAVYTKNTCPDATTIARVQRAVAASAGITL